MNKVRVFVSKGNYERVRDLHYSVIKVHSSIVVSPGDVILVENPEESKKLGFSCPLPREVVDIDLTNYYIEGSEFYDVFVRNNNYLS